MIGCEGKKIQVNVFKLWAQVCGRFIFQPRQNYVDECIIFLNEGETKILEFNSSYLRKALFRLFRVFIVFFFFFDLLDWLNGLGQNFWFFKNFLNFVVWVYHVRIFDFRFLWPTLLFYCLLVVFSLENTLLLWNFLTLFDDFWLNFLCSFLPYKRKSLCLAQDSVKSSKYRRQILYVTMPKTNWIRASNLQRKNRFTRSRHDEVVAFDSEERVQILLFKSSKT